ncbi:DUF2059 domain-containing protein [Cellvibrio sp. OA-2007]|uniref:DUF2059 domain-containing protein n=1 Tax=Cellvibrio sp. OA-2007 TaxID=529823 RepID=UPI0007824DEC|nr:DUF2059 domain-containing protein [Cellvibrio sp. OA-2007]
MNFNKVVVLFCSLVFSLNVFSSEPATTASVEKLLELTEASKMVDAVYAQIDSMSSGIATQMGLTEKDRPEFDAYMKKVSALVTEEMSWEKMKEPMMQVYIKHFTEQEIQGMIEFYNSDIGKSTIKKMPLVMQDSMGVSQKMMEGVFPKIKVLMDEFSTEMKAKKAKPEAKE